MYFSEKFKSGAMVSVIVRKSTENRLRTTCFRGKTLNRAGNFFLWNSEYNLFSDPLMVREFLSELERLWREQDFGTHSVSITHDLAVGWESTDPIVNYDNHDLEPFEPNRRSCAFRVKTSRTDLLAPKTNQVTIVYEFKPEEDGPAAVVYSIYPGFDIGELNGDVTEREQRVFFDWNHPGEL